MEEAISLKTSAYWLTHSLIHWVICKSFEFSILHKHFYISPITQGLNSCNTFINWFDCYDLDRCFLLYRCEFLSLFSEKQGLKLWVTQLISLF